MFLVSIPVRYMYMYIFSWFLLIMSNRIIKPYPKLIVCDWYCVWFETTHSFSFFLMQLRMKLFVFLCVMTLGHVTGSANYSQRLQKMEKIMEDLLKQLVTQQFYVEERIRSDGASGKLKKSCPLTCFNNVFHQLTSFCKACIFLRCLLDPWCPLHKYI